jgi:hypothetical protein
VNYENDLQLSEAKSKIEELEKEITSLKINSDHCPLCQSRKDLKIAIDDKKTADKLAD